MKAFGNIAKDGQVRAIASGTMTDGKAVVVNSDGTVSVVGGADQSVGNEGTYAAAITDRPTSAYDSNANRVVVAYRDENNGDYITAIVGTVSGSAVSFGTEVVVASVAITKTAIVYDANAQKVVVFYDDSNNGNFFAKVGTVSGTSISFGSQVTLSTQNPIEQGVVYDANAQKVVVFYGDNANSNRPTAKVGTISGTDITFGDASVVKDDASDYNDITYDSNANKVVVCWQDQGNSNRGTAAVGTVSGTDISFGSAAVFDTGSIENIGVGFDASANKVVVAYQRGGSDNDGYTAIGTVSGTSISFATAVRFTTNSTREYFVIYDSNANSVVITFRDTSDSNKLKFMIGTVSGTSITLSTPTQFQASGEHPSLAYDSSTNKVIIAYRATSGGNNHGKYVVLQVGFTNITSENFIGFSDGAFADGESAVVNTTSTIDRNQSSLTAGQTYFVQTDGTIGTTAASPSVTAGTAISATEIIVKG